MLGIPEGEYWQLVKTAAMTYDKPITSLSSSSSASSAATVFSSSSASSSSTTATSSSSSTTTTAAFSFESLLAKRGQDQAVIAGEHQFHIWINFNLREKYLAAVELFGQEDVDALIGIIHSCLSLDPSKRLHAEEALRHPLFVKRGVVVPKSIPSEHDSNEEKKDKQELPPRVMKAYKFILMNFERSQKILNCHPNTIVIATDILDRLFTKKSIMDKLQTGKLSPKIMGLTVLLLAMKFNQGEITYELDLMNAVVISIFHMTEKELKKVKCREIEFCSYLKFRMVSEQCKKKLAPFIGYF